jgi:hypothetical protein
MRYMSDISPPARDLEDVKTEWGVMPRWKARAMCIGEIQAVLSDAGIRTDGVAPATTTAPPDELPPRPVADDTPAIRAGDLTAADLALIERAVDDLETRIDAMEARQRAYAALLDAERQIEQELGIDPEDEDDPPMQLN